MICSDQYRWCNPTVPDQCSPWSNFTSFQDAARFDTTLAFNDAQIATAARLSATADSMPAIVASVTRLNTGGMLSPQMIPTCQSES